ncbi:MAG: PKD domain-containing protein [Croceivirga sp.]
MRTNFPSICNIRIFLILCFFSIFIQGQSWDQSSLDFNGLTDVSSGVTSLMFGPDGKLYVAEYPGLIKVLTINRVDSKNYDVINVEILDGIQTMADHNDDGSIFNSVERETTGITVGGTPSNPIIYVSSSDFRIGAGSGGGNGDVNLDTNSGVITRFSWNGSSWDVVDLVRGLPRSEENHATNGLELATINGTNYLIVASGGHTNGGAPSENFVFTCEYALSAAILAINLDMINAMSIKVDNGRNYIYDLPTLDDPTRANVNGITDPNDPLYNGIDINDPFGGNDGLNQAIVDPSGPVQIVSPGYRNAYDLVVTESGALFVTDNGANGSWGGFPENEGTGNVTNEYNPSEPGSSSPDSNGEQIDNEDHLHLITDDLQNYTFGSFYGGHPNPTRANPNGAGLYTDDGVNQVFRTLTYDPDGSTPGSTTDPSLALPANWPPVNTANPIEGDWRGPSVANPEGPNDDLVTIWETNTNGLDEYTASNFGGIMQGDLIAGSNQGEIRRVQLNPDGSLNALDQTFLTGISGDALGITCNGDLEIFPGTIWIGTLGGTNTGSPSGGSILVYEPLDFLECTEPGEPGYDETADGDLDGYLNLDEEQNGTGVCNGGSQPDDFDKVAGAPLVSNLNDTDDDNDGIPDATDPFQLGDPTTAGSDAFELPVFNDFFNNQQGLGGYAGLGLTGLMNNGDTGPNWLDWIDEKDDGPNPDDVTGGAPGIMTSHMGSGTAAGSTNTQTKGYQYGVQVDNTTGTFTVIGGMKDFNEPLGIYQNPGVVNPELGLFIGDGTQSNYIKFVVTQTGFLAVQENNDIADTPITNTVVGTPSSGILFYFVINPVTGQVDLEYKIDNQVRTALGTIFATGAILNALQSNSADLAVGLIGTSGAVGVEVEGTWDFLNVLADDPILTEELPDINRLVDSPNEQIDLDNFFEDDGGVENLTYTVQTNSNNAIGATINDNVLTLTFPSTEEISNITIRATDGEALFIEDTFIVNVTEAIVLYRVNAGGPQIASIDGDIDWEEDTVLNPNQYLSNSTVNKTFGGSVSTVDGSVNPSSTPFSIYETERFDDVPGSPNITYSFPVPQSGNYEVRLFMGNGFDGSSQQGERIFNTTIEGVDYPLLSDIDLSASYGHNVGTMISHVVSVSDGLLDIQFVHGIIENPLINGIEILDAPNSETPIYVFDIADQTNNNGEQLIGNLGVQATGGDGNLNYSAVGLPPGVTIEPTNGQLGGTIDNNATSGSPYNVTIAIDDSDGLNSDEVEISFVWNIIDALAYRVNAAGNLVPSTDIGPDWENNAISGVQNGGNYNVNTGKVLTATGIEFQNKDVSIPAYIDTTIFGEIFGGERFDLPTGDEMEFTFLAGNTNDYVVNLYFANSFEGTDQVGDRIFDIAIEGVTVENNLDLISKFGHQIAGMLSYPVTVTDGTLNVQFNREVENPVVSGIEIFRVDNSNPTLSISGISNQTNQIGENVSFNVSASGGAPSEQMSYYISGQPEGISIDSNTGEISGNISAAAAAGGPAGNGLHSVVVTAVKPLSAPTSANFTWNIPSDFIWNSLDEDESYTPRHENSFVQAGDKFYVMGGREQATTVDVYDFEDDSWTALTDSAPFEFNHFQAIEFQGLIWVIGAFNNNAFPNEVPEDHIWMFDPITLAWIEGPEIPLNRRRGSTGLAVYNDKFYVVGGNTDGHDGGFVNWFDEYDPSTGVWTPLSDAPNARDHFAAVIIGDKLYAAGGRLSGGTGGVWKPLIPEVDIYDFSTETWSTLSSSENIPTPRAGAAAVNFNEKLVVIGGEVLNEPVYGVTIDDSLIVTEQYDPVTQEWKRLPDMNFERHGTQALVSGSGVFITAGSDDRGDGNQLNMEVLGENMPIGQPSVSSEVSAPATVIIADGNTENVSIDLTSGNIGIFVKDVIISGANAADFQVVSQSIDNTLISPNSTQDIQIELTGTGPNRSALLTLEYGNNDFINVVLTNNPDVQFAAENPGNQYNYEGDSVNLQIETTGLNNIAYSATGLPPNLDINTNTGLITGTVDDGTCSGGSGDSFVEENGLVIIEAESGTLTGNWSLTNIGGESGIVAGANNFNSPEGGGIIEYDIVISTPGVYRFNWNNAFSGSDPTEENDNWLKFENDANVWFFGIDNVANPGTEATIIADLLAGETDNYAFPKGSGRETVGIDTDSGGTEPEGSGGLGYFKVYRSGGTGGTYDWQALTSDFDAHDLYVWFVNPGTYTMKVAERSIGHAIDRMALYKVDGPDYSDSQLSSFDESSGCQNTPGAAENSPYEVVVTETEQDNPDPIELNFNWIIGEQGDLIAVPEANIIEGFAPLTVNFTGENSLDDVGVETYLWDFNDGNTSNIESPTNEFADPGVYEVSLTVTDASNNTDTKTITITVNAVSVTGVSVSPTSSTIAIAETVDLIEEIAPLDATNQNVGWSTSDVNIATVDTNGVVTGVSQGEVTVTVTTEDGGFIATSTIVVVVPVTGIVVTPSPISVELGNTVNLTANIEPSNATNQNVIWSSSDEAVAIVDANGVVTGISLGQVTITATTEDGNFMSSAIVDVVSEIILVTDISVDPDSAAINVGESISLTETVNPSNATNQNVTWSSNDESIATVTNQGIVTGVASGEVSNTVTTIDGGFTAISTIQVNESTTNTPPVAVIVATPLSGDTPLEVVFNGEGSSDDDAIVSYTWDFDDGTGSNEINPTKTYTLPGQYEVSLTVADAEGLENTDTVIISVNDPNVNDAPVAIVSATPFTGEAPLEVNFDGSASSDDVGIVTYTWDFGDGNSSNDINPTNTFTTPQEYTVVLTVMDAEGLMDTDTIIITVTEPSSNQAPVAIIAASTTTGDAPLEISFTGNGSTDDVGVVSYLWDFDNGDTSTQNNPTYTFEVAGTYRVSLTVTDGAGLTDTEVVEIDVIDNTTLELDMQAVIAPNPTFPSDDFALIYVSDLPDDVVVTKINLHDSTGRLLGVFTAQSIFNGGRYEIPIFGLRDGLYNVTLEMSEGDAIGIQLLVKN